MRSAAFMVVLLLARSACAVIRLGNSPTGPIETVPPIVSGALVQNWRTIDIMFSEPVLAPAVVVTSNYAVSGRGQGMLAVHPDSVGIIGGNTCRLAWTSGEMAAGAPLAVTVSNAQDLMGNVIGVPNSGTGIGADAPATVAVGNSASVRLDTVPPTVASVAALTCKTVMVAFSKPMLSPGVTTASIYGISGAGIGNLAATPSSASGAGPYTLEWISGEMFDGGPLTLSVGFAQDTLGNVLGAPSTGDTTAIGTIPTGTVTINDGDTYATSPAVTLALTANDGIGSGVSFMRFSADAQYPALWSEWEPFTGSKSWDFSQYRPDDGVRTIHAELRDAAGNISTALISDSIILDSTPPTAIIARGNPSPTSLDTLSFGVNFSEPLATPLTDASVSLAFGSLPGAIAVTGTEPNYTVTVTLSNPDADGLAGIQVSGMGITDRAGNPYVGGVSSYYLIHNWHGLTTQPANAKLYTRDSHAFAVNGDFGPITPTFQWEWNDNHSKTIHDGPAAASWTISNATAANAGTYWCDVTYDGVPHESAQASLSVADHLRITSPPIGAFRQAGDAHTFAVIATGGYPPLAYSWKKNGAPISGATQASFALRWLTLGDTGSYTVEVSDSNTDTQSASARLSVVQTVSAAGPISLAVLAGITLVLGAFVISGARRRGII